MAKSFEDLPIATQEHMLNAPLAIRPGGPLFRPLPLVRSARPYRTPKDLEIPPDIDDPDDWQKDALCREIGISVFFAEDEESLAHKQEKAEIARRACKLCGLSLVCLLREQEYVDDNDKETHGVLGATTQGERRKMWGKQE